MKNKLFILPAIFLLIFTGCEKKSTNTTADIKKPSIELSLTQEEINNTAGNANLGAQLLVRKAILKEMEENKYSPEEEKELNTAIENLKLEFFLNKTASKKTVVTDEEVLATYKENGEKLKNADIEVVFPQIKEKIFLYKVNNEKIAYMNSLVEKYKLNDKIKEYYKPIEDKENDENKKVNPITPVETEKKKID